MTQNAYRAMIGLVASVGLAVGAAVASSNTAAATSSAYNAGVATGVAVADTTSAYNAGVATGVAAANTTNAYNAGVATGAAAGTPANYSMGANYAALPAGAMSIPKNGTTYYLSGNTWFQPSFGANGVYYRVVPTP